MTRFGTATMVQLPCPDAPAELLTRTTTWNEPADSVGADTEAENVRLAVSVIGAGPAWLKPSYVAVQSPSGARNVALTNAPSCTNVSDGHDTLTTGLAFTTTVLKSANSFQPP